MQRDGRPGLNKGPVASVIETVRKITITSTPGVTQCQCKSVLRKLMTESKSRLVFLLLQHLMHVTLKRDANNGVSIWDIFTLVLGPFNARGVHFGDFRGTSLKVSHTYAAGPLSNVGLPLWGFEFIQPYSLNFFVHIAAEFLPCVAIPWRAVLSFNRWYRLQVRQPEHTINLLFCERHSVQGEWSEINPRNKPNEQRYKSTYMGKNI
jgi:hypothetical protein